MPDNVPVEHPMRFPQPSPLSFEQAVDKGVKLANQTGMSQLVYQVLIHDGGFDVSPYLPIYGEQVGERIYPDA
jgi:hypothetical protein